MTHFTDLQPIVVARPDGGVTVHRMVCRASADCFDPATAANRGLTLGEDGVWSRDISDEMVEAELTRLGIEWVSWHRAEEADIPERSFREAWTVAGGAIYHDMAKARAIHRERLRRDRAPRLAALDVAYQRADETGDSGRKAEIVAAKQALRDAPANPAIDAAGTIDDLKAITLPE